MLASINNFCSKYQPSKDTRTLSGLHATHTTNAIVSCKKKVQCSEVIQNSNRTISTRTTKPINWFLKHCLLHNDQDTAHTENQHTLKQTKCLQEWLSILSYLTIGICLSVKVNGWNSNIAAKFPPTQTLESSAGKFSEGLEIHRKTVKVLWRWAIKPEVTIT